MALPPGLSHWKCHCFSGKKDSETLSENRKGRAVGRYSGGASYLPFFLWCSFSDPLRTVSCMRSCSFSSGNVLVLSASCRKVVKDRKHEGV